MWWWSLKLGSEYSQHLLSPTDKHWPMWQKAKILKKYSEGYLKWFQVFYKRLKKLFVNYSKSKFFPKEMKPQWQNKAQHSRADSKNKDDLAEFFMQTFKARISEVHSTTSKKCRHEGPVPIKNHLELTSNLSTSIKFLKRNSFQVLTDSLCTPHR